MISLLNQNTRGLTHMNKKQMWKIIEKKGLLTKLLNLKRITRENDYEGESWLFTLKQMKKCFFKGWQTQKNIITKVMFFHIQQWKRVEK